MKFSDLQKYLLLLMLSLGIVQGSYACFVTNDLDVSKKSTTLHSNSHQSIHSNFLYVLMEENIDDDSNDVHFWLDFSLPSYNNLMFHELHQDTLKLYNSFSSQSPYNQKINILNRTFLI